MRSTPARLLLAVAALLPALPAHAETYVVKLTNGATFESRYQPKQAAWDANYLTVIDETGLEIALAKAIVVEVATNSEQRGFGRVIDARTVDLGFAPNDLPQQQQAAAAAAQQMQGAGGFFSRSFDQQQFVEPGKLGGGLPVFGGNFGGFGSGGQQQAPAPAPPPAPVAAPLAAPAPAAPAPPPATGTSNPQ